MPLQVNVQAVANREVGTSRARRLYHLLFDKTWPLPLKRCVMATPTNERLRGTHVFHVSSNLCGTAVWPTGVFSGTWLVLFRVTSLAQEANIRVVVSPYQCRGGDAVVPPSPGTKLNMFPSTTLSECRSRRRSRRCRCGYKRTSTPLAALSKY